MCASVLIVDDKPEKAADSAKSMATDFGAKHSSDAGKKSSKRKSRSQVTCHCDRYTFPHRQDSSCERSERMQQKWAEEKPYSMYDEATGIRTQGEI